MRQPNFFIVGAPRCGTTSLYEYLKVHPDIFMPESKEEPHFFAKDINTCRAYRRFRDIEAYAALFSGATNEKRVGEASVMYLYSEVAPYEMKKACEEAAIIIMLRNPVEMIYSLHSKLVVLADEDIQDFGAALEAEQDRKRGLMLPKHMGAPREALFYRYLANYTPRVRRYFDALGRENVHVILFDDLKTKPSDVYRQTLIFLDVDPDFTPDFEVSNPHRALKYPGLKRFVRDPPPVFRSVARRLVPAGLRRGIGSVVERMNTREAKRRPMDPVLRRRLQEDFSSGNQELSQLLGRDLSQWSDA